MNKKLCYFILLFFTTASIIAQEKIGNKIYLYGNLENSIEGKTLIHYGINDPKGENRIINNFGKYGVDIASWNKFFLPGYEYSDSEINEVISTNEIQTIIFVKLTDTSSYVQSNLHSIYNSSTNFAFSYGNTSEVIGSVSLLIEIYSLADNFDKPLAVISGNANNSWGEAGSQRSVVNKIVNRALRAMNKHNAFR